MDDDPLDILRDMLLRINRPRMHLLVMKHADVRLDRALFPLTMRLGREGAKSVAELADAFGLDQSTVSRQLAQLESLKLVERRPRASDRRVREAELTARGQHVYERLEAARLRLKDEVLANWPDADKKRLARMLRKLSQAVDSFDAKYRNSE
jgi:DNA-binding MarR family transcriptional regulator